MTNFNSVEELWVFRDDIHVANLRRLPRGCEFRYSDAFIESGQPPIALHLPKSPEGLRVEGIANLPTYFAGLLPEGIMFSAVKTLIGSSADDLFAVLAATGADAIGDIEVRIPGEAERKPTINLDEAAALVRSLLNHKGQLSFNHLAAIPGVQPKISLGEIVRASRKATYIAKFDSPEFPGLMQNEFAFMRLAKRCHLDVAHVNLKSNALVVKRFDRAFSEQGTEKLHLEDMVQAMNLFPNSKYSMEYGDLMAAMRDVGTSPATLLVALRLYVFSYIIGNGDLHAKNVSLIRDKQDGQWQLSPAYDLLSTLPYSHVLPGADRMALALIDEAHGRFTVDDFVSFGAQFGLPEKAVTGMIKKTARAVAKFGPDSLCGYVAADVVQTIQSRANSLLDTA